MTQKDLRLKEALKELAAEYFSRESNRTSLITITDVNIDAKGAKAQILITVLPEKDEDHALEFVRRKLGEFREYVSEHARIMRLPFFSADIDRGEKNRQVIEDISVHLHDNP